MLSVTFNISKPQQAFSDTHLSEWTALIAIITDSSAWARGEAYVVADYWNCPIKQ